MPGLLFLTCAVGVAGCGMIPPAAPTLARRNESLRTLQMSQEDLKVFVDNVRLRTALVFHNKDPRQILQKDSEGEFKITGEGGAGAILTHDGYILTAAHCLSESEPVVVMSFLPPNSLTATDDVRIVWMGNPKEFTKDIALIKANLRSSEAFTWADDGNLQRGTPLAGAGFSVWSETFASVWAGTVEAPRLASAELENGTAITVGFRGPTAQGDSGGPIVTPNGRLLGVFNGWTTAFTLPEDASMQWASAVVPDPQWIERLIAEDRARHSTDALTRDDQ